MRKLMSVVMALAMILSIVPVAAMASDTEYISTVSAAMAFPTPGKAVSFDLTVPENAPYSIEITSYKDESTNADLEAGDIIGHDKVYRLTMTVAADEGYIFLPSWQVSDDIKYGDYSANIYYRYTNDAKSELYYELFIYSEGGFEISDLEAGIKAPVASRIPEKAVQPENVPYFAKVDWLDAEYNRYLAPYEYFRLGKEYIAEISFTPRDRFEFVDLEDMKTTVKVNGQEVEPDSVIYDYPSVVAKVKLTANDALSGLTALTAAEGTVTSPKAGNNPSFAVGVPSDANYTAKVAGWYSNLTDIPLTAEDVFEDNVTYTAYVNFIPNAGYGFDDQNLAVKITDGENELHVTSTYVESDGILSATVDFIPEIQELPLLDKLSADISTPKAGKNPVFEAKCPAGSHYTAEITSWYNETDEEEIWDDGVFEAGKQYSAAIWFTPDEGYALSPINDVEFVISDGSKIIPVVEKYDLFDGRYSVDVTFSLPAGNLPQNAITKIEASMTAPEVNAKPNFTISVPQNAKYEAEIIEWADAEDFVEMTDEDAFAAGKIYAANINFKPKEGFEFVLPNLTEFNVTAGEEKVLLSNIILEDGIYDVTALFSTVEEPEVISSVKCTIGYPSAGTAPDFEPAVPEGANYEVMVSSWSDINGEIMEEDDTFTSDSNYTLLLDFYPEEGYSFDKLENMNVTVIAGEKEMYAEIIPLGDERVGVQVDFIKIIDSLKAGIAAPEANKLPGSEVKVPEGAVYTAKLFTWLDDSFEPLAEGEKFEAGKTYYAEIHWFFEDCSLTDDVTITLNNLAPVETASLNNESIAGLFKFVLADEEPQPEPEPDPERPDRPTPDDDDDDEDDEIILKPSKPSVIKPSMNPVTGAEI